MYASEGGVVRLEGGCLVTRNRTGIETVATAGQQPGSTTPTREEASTSEAAAVAAAAAAALQRAEQEEAEWYSRRGNVVRGNKRDFVQR